MFRVMDAVPAWRKPIALATVAILLIAATTGDLPAGQVAAAPASQQPARFLSPPYYGTTAVTSVYDHKYPTYSGYPNTDPAEDAAGVLHYDNTLNGPGARSSYDGHNGVDYDLDYELVRAAASGDVNFAGWDNPAVHGGSSLAGMGLYVHLEHDNGHDTLYGHMSVLRVRTDDQEICRDGELSCILGISGNTGWSSGPHLHFELEPPGGRSVNPYGWIGGAGLDPWEDWTRQDPGHITHISYDLWVRHPSITNGDVYPSGAPLHAPPVIEDEPGYVTIDDGNAGYSETTGCWTVNTTAGWNGDHRHRNVPDGNCTARWSFPSAQSPGPYNVFIHVPNVNATTDAAQYTIHHTESPSRPWSKQSAWAVVNQVVYPNTHHPSSWVYAGTYYFDSNSHGTDYVQLEAQPLDPVGTSSIAADAVRFAPVVYRTYLPLVARRWPPIPYVPVLNAIDNPDHDGSYTVSWQPADLAETYALQESLNASFAGAWTRYYGTGTSWTATGKPVGTYYYRVRARNSWGYSGWSNVEHATVLPPTWFYAVADTMVLAGYATTNYGSRTDMWAGYDTSLAPDGMNARSLVQFDLSAVPSSTSIDQAMLWLHLNTSFDNPGVSRVIVAYRASSSWGEGSVTWNTQPGFGGMYGGASIPHSGWGWYGIDVTGLARAWIDGQYTNCGVWAFGNENPGDSNWRGFCTREHASGCEARLQITYSGMSSAAAPAEVPGAIPGTSLTP